MLVRGTTFLAWTFLCELVFLLGFLPARALGGAEAWRCALFRGWARPAGRLLGMRIEVRGRAPQPPYLLVSNHLSYVDIILLAGETSSVFVSKAEIAHWPLVGWLARTMGTLFLDRGKKREVARIGTEIAQCFERGQGVCLFPEGTSSGGADVLPFRSSLLEPAVRGQWPVWTATLSYRTEAGSPPAHERVAWWRDMPFLPHFLGLLRLDGFDARVVFGEAPHSGCDRKDLAGRLHAAVSSNFKPMMESTDPCLSLRA